MNISSTSHVRWFLVCWLFVLSAVSYLDRVNISVAGRSIAAEYGLSNVQLGYVFSAMLVGYALFQTVGGRLADRFGPRRVLTAGVVWWGIFTGLTALVPSTIRGALFLFIAIRFLLGAGEAVVYPSSNQFVARWIPAHERGTANGWIFAGVGAGAGLSPPLITYFMLHYGWRSSFWACAIIGLIAGIIWYLMARDEPAQHPWVSASELATIRSGLPVETDLGGTDLSVKDAGLVPWANRLAEQGSVGGHPQLFQFRLYRMDFLQLVLYLPGPGARTEFEIERVLRHASSGCDVGLQPVGWRHQRPAYKMAQPALGAVRSGGVQHCPGRNIHRLWLPG